MLCTIYNLLINSKLSESADRQSNNIVTKLAKITYKNTPFDEHDMKGALRCLYQIRLTSTKSSSSHPATHQPQSDTNIFPMTDSAH